MEKLLQRLAEIDASLKAVLANDELTAEQLAQHDQLQKDRTKVMKEIGRERDALARDAETRALTLSASAAQAAARQVEEDAAAQKAQLDAQTASRQARQVSQRITTPDAPVSAAPAAVSTTAAATGAATTPAATAAAAAGERITIPAQYRKFAAINNFKGSRRHPRTGREMNAEERAYRFGMWGAMQLLQMNPMHFGHLREGIERYLAIDETGASGYTYTIPEEFGADIIDLRERFGVARRVCKMVPMTSDTRVDPRRRGGLTAYCISENAAVSTSNKIWDDVRLTAREWGVMSVTSNQVRMDSIINWGDDLAGEIAYAFAKSEDDNLFNGDGSSTYGRIQGIRSKLANCDNAGHASVGLVQGSGAAWSNLVNADFDAVLGQLPQYADVPGETCWIMHRTFFYAVIERLVQASGGTMAYEIRQGATEAPNMPMRPTYKGYPVEFSQIMPSASAATTVFALLGNFKLGVSFGDRQMDEIAFSEHASIGGANLFERNQMAIRGIERYDINVHDVGHATVGNGGDGLPGPIVGLKTA